MPWPLMTFFRFIRFSLVFLLSGFYSVSSYATYTDGAWVPTDSGGYPDCAAVGPNGLTSDTVFGTLARVPSWGHGCASSLPDGWTFRQYCQNEAQSCGWDAMISKPGAPPCDSPNTMSGGSCVAPPPNPCEALAGTSAIPSGQIAYGENAAGVNPTQAAMCNSSRCIIKIGSATTIPIGDNKQANYISNGTYTGEQAPVGGNCPVTVLAPTPKDPTLPKPIDTITPAANTPSGIPASGADCPPGSAFGQVNGVPVCSPAGSQLSYVPETTTQNNNGTVTNSTSTQTDTVLGDGSINRTITTTSTGSGPGGASSSSTTTNTNTGGQNGLNGTDGKDGKDFDGFDLGAAPNAESGTVDAGLPAPGSGADGAGGTAKTFTVTPHFTGSGACIADRTVSALGVDVVIPLSALCDWFGMMYKILSIVAIFVALRILVMS